ncbi:hypothetical protein V5738_04830 [Salinisphaera sp. SPP-AMP-43]|uniref:COG3904 family protein n=1 Tax=Salinisphaera sp. SPP-AMP-43 TaxID=3121288 RepID=UPI003C6DBBCB
MRPFIIVMAVLLQAFATSASSAQIQRHVMGDDDNSLTYFTLQGEITSGDHFDFDHINDKPLVILNSVGGNMETAMALGRELRKADARAIVRKTEVCISACVFVFAGAVDRTVFGRIGIHRPYPTRTGDETQEQAQQEFKQMKSKSQRYLEQMNISVSLLNEMIRVPSSRVHYLSDGELAKLGLTGKDPAYQYKQDSEDAARYGISRRELLRRRRKSRAKCSSISAKYHPWKKVQCEDATMWGLSVSEMKQRQQLVRTHCTKQKYGDKGQALKCQISIMQNGLNSQ